MLSEKETTRLSKFLSLVLRHKPEAIGIILDENGWTNVTLLLEKLNAAGNTVDFIQLKHIVDTNSKKRFAFNDTFDKIRASQGHTVEIELGYSPQLPPEILYHGTAKKNIDFILAAGLNKRERTHVHLSTEKAIALAVGQRYGKPVLFEVLAAEMVRDSYVFYLSDNNVWLTDSVPPRYLRLLPF